MWTVQRAMEVLPALRIIPVSEELLRAVPAAWQQVYQLLLVACDGEAGRVLMRSCDEASLRVPRRMEALSWARAIRAAVRSQTGCSCSVGFGPSQVVAKLAVKVCKPDGVKAVVGADDVRDFLAEVPTSSLPQVGRQLAAKLKEHGLERCCGGALGPQGDVERHVNRHFEAEREPNRRSTSRPAAGRLAGEAAPDAPRLRSRICAKAQAAKRREGCQGGGGGRRLRGARLIAPHGISGLRACVASGLCQGMRRMAGVPRRRIRVDEKVASGTRRRDSCAR